MTATAENVASSPNRLRKRPARPKGKIFTVKEIQSLRPEGPDGEHYYVTGPKGLAIRVLKSGVKTFYFKYTLNRKKDQVFLGNFAEKPEKSDEITLAMATEKHTEFLSLVNKGLSPKAPAVSAPMLATAPVVNKSFETMTLQDLADAYLKFTANPDKRAASTHREYKRTINTYILPFFEKKKIEKLTDIQKNDAHELVLSVSEKLKANGTPTKGQARAVLKIGRVMFNFQIEKDNKTHKNPFSDLEKTDEIEPLMDNVKEPRFLTDEEIVSLWWVLNSLDGPGSASAARALMLILVTGQRPGEVAAMHRREITGDRWVIPAGRIKTRNKRRERHLVILTPLAMRIIGDFPGYIFPSPSPGYEDKPITEKTLTRLVNEGTVNKDEEITRPIWLGLLEEWTPNDLRKTVRTNLTELGCPLDIGERILNHAKEVVHGTYDLNENAAAKKRWLTKWSKKLEGLLPGQTAAIRSSDETYNVQELEELVAKMPLTEVAKQLNITDNAVRKRCKKHNIELKPRGWWLKGKARGW